MSTPGKILPFLEHLLQSGPFRLGQILVSPDLSLRHAEDEEPSSLTLSTSPYDAVEIARYDDSGKYRPLKTAPNLRHGWLLRLSSLQEVLDAIDLLYPAALGTALAVEQGRGVPVSFRTTLARQSGMYTVVKRLTDPQAQDLITSTCHQGCLRKILWSISEQTPVPPDPHPDDSHSGDTAACPIYCLEACNLLIAAGRPLAKNNPPTLSFDGS